MKLERHVTNEGIWGLSSKKAASYCACTEEAAAAPKHSPITLPNMVVSTLLWLITFYQTFKPLKHPLYSTSTQNHSVVAARGSEQREQVSIADAGQVNMDSTRIYDITQSIQSSRLRGANLPGDPVAAAAAAAFLDETDAVCFHTCMLT